MCIEQSPFMHNYGILFQTCCGLIFSLQPVGSEWHSGFFTGCQGPAATGAASGVGLGELANSAEPRNEKAKLQGVSRTVLPRSFRRCAWQ